MRIIPMWGTPYDGYVEFADSKQNVHIEGKEYGLWIRRGKTVLHFSLKVEKIWK